MSPERLGTADAGALIGDAVSATWDLFPCSEMIIPFNPSSK
jgi:hypothetical protein